MVSKRNRSEKGKDKEIPIDYNIAKFTSIMAKIRFDKGTEINKNIIVERGLEFQLRYDFYFEGIMDIIVALGWRWLIKNRDDYEIRVISVFCYSIYFSFY